MQPKIVKMDKRYIVGLFGDRGKQEEISKRFDELYNQTPFEKTDTHKCYIYLWSDGTNAPKKGKDYFTGFESDCVSSRDIFDTFVIPACEWAIFEVNPAKWWKSGDEKVEGWIKNNEVYSWGEYDGAVFQLEYYKEKFSGSENPSSLMEVWYPLERRGE